MAAFLHWEYTGRSHVGLVPTVLARACLVAASRIRCVCTVTVMDGVARLATKSGRDPKEERETNR